MLAQQNAFVRATPKKLGPPPRNDNHYRDNWHRQLLDQSSQGKLSSRHALRLYDLFWGFSDDTAKDCWPSQETLAKRWQCSIRSVQRTIDAGRRSGVLATAQLKGYNPEAGSWFCSSNTHRAKLLADWIDRLKASRGLKRDAQRQHRLESRANPPGSNKSPSGASRPSAPDVDLEEYDRVARDRVSPDESRRRAQALKNTILGRPPPQ